MVGRFQTIPSPRLPVASPQKRNSRVALRRNATPQRFRDAFTLLRNQFGLSSDVATVYVN